MKNMKKKTKFILIGISFLTFFTLFIGISKFTKVSAATIGQQLMTPEVGWKRFDDRASQILYKGTGSWLTSTNPNRYNTTVTYSSINTATQDTNYIEFRFRGTKIRILDELANSRPRNSTMKIDGVVYPFSSYNANYTASAPLFCGLATEVLGLKEGVHTVQIYGDGSGYFSLDAIDIDSTGSLVEPSEIICTGISIDRTSLDMQKGGTASLIATVVPSDATKKDVKWVSSNPQVASVNENTGIINPLAVGTATITVTTTDGTNLSASCTVTVGVVSRAILEITMSNGERKEYDLPVTDVNNFVDWYNGNTSASYKINVTTNVKPFTSRSEYLAHDKISSFEVKEYTSN